MIPEQYFADYCDGVSVRLIRKRMIENGHDAIVSLYKEKLAAVLNRAVGEAGRDARHEALKEKREKKLARKAEIKTYGYRDWEPDEEKKAFALRSEGHTYIEIADILGRSVAGVRGKLSQIMKRVVF